MSDFQRSANGTRDTDLPRQKAMQIFAAIEQAAGDHRMRKRRLHTGERAGIAAGTGADEDATVHHLSQALPERGPAQSHVRDMPPRKRRRELLPRALTRHDHPHRPQSFCMTSSVHPKMVCRGLDHIGGEHPHCLFADADTDTLPPDDMEAVASYAAAVLFDQIAAATSGDSSLTIAADAVDHKQKPSEFAKRATTLRQRYHDLLGIDPKRLKGGSTLAQVRLPSSRGGRRLIQRNGRG